MAQSGNGLAISEHLRGLYEFAGNWQVSQRLWRDPNGEPEISSGRTECRILLDGLLVMMMTEIVSGNQMKGIALMTQNPTTQALEMAWVDTLAGGGILKMTGAPDKAPSRAELTEQHKTATQERVWSSEPIARLQDANTVASAACLPQDVTVAAVQQVHRTQTAAAAGGEELPLRVVENRISADHWVLDFFAPGADGQQYLVQENTFTRA